MKSKLFYENHYEEVAERIKVFLNEQQDFLSGSTVKSTRAAGDAIVDILSESFELLLTDQWCKTYSSQFARRAMADLAFNDHDDFYYVIDVKTHRLSTKFNMPNLTSVQRLARFYEDDSNYFVVLMVSIRCFRTRRENRRGDFCSNRIPQLGLLDNWGFGLGADSDCQLKHHNASTGVFET